MNSLGKYAIVKIAEEKDAKIEAERKANREHARKIANSSSRIRKALWKTHQQRLNK
jgi:hypothetical protein